MVVKCLVEVRYLISFSLNFFPILDKSNTHDHHTQIRVQEKKHAFGAPLVFMLQLLSNSVTVKSRPPRIGSEEIAQIFEE